MSRGSDVTRRMVVVPDWDSHHSGASSDANGDTVIKRGDDNDDPAFTCGSFETPILVGVPQSLVRHFVFRCKRCWRISEGLSTDPGDSRLDRILASATSGAATSPRATPNRQRYESVMAASTWVVPYDQAIRQEPPRGTTSPAKEAELQRAVTESKRLIQLVLLGGAKESEVYQILERGRAPKYLGSFTMAVSLLGDVGGNDDRAAEFLRATYRDSGGSRSLEGCCLASLVRRLVKTQFPTSGLRGQLQKGGNRRKPHSWDSATWASSTTSQKP
jgi:hypothetical protein